ncbi:MAG: ATP-binding cassette domain-containing protein [Pseudomonadota bacterium]|nr:ATP-binding cassette domain-containing protein [Pseudomonadota bacterium]
MRGNRTLFTGLSFSLGEGEIVGLCGDSGSGKTSLGDALLGLLPYQGNIAFHTLLHRYQTLKLYQDPPSSFAHHTTLNSLIDDVIKLHKVSKKRADLLSAQLGLNQRLFERSASEVSGGELQRIALLRALLLKPKLLIADEPTSRLDPITSKAITHLLVDRCREENCTVLFISHDRTQLEKVCDRVIDLQSLTTSKAVI